MRILFIAESVSMAHVGRPLKLAKWAFGAGHEVHFACSSKFYRIENLDSLPFTSHPLDCIEPSKFYARLRNGNFPYTLEELQEYQKYEMQLMKEIQPSLVVCDFRLSAPISCELLKIPCAQISNLHWAPHSSCEFLPDIHSNLHRLPKTILKGLMKIIRPILFRNFGQAIHRLRKMNGLAAMKDLREIYTAGTYTLYSDMPSFTKIENLPINHKILGPIIWDPENSTTTLKHLEEKLIYVTIGSTGNIESLKNLLRALMKTQQQIIISGLDETMEATIKKELPIVTEFCQFTRFANPNEFLHRCILTVCHGGSGTVYQSLARGVPILCLPSNPDQYLVSASVKKSKLGSYLFERNPTVEAFGKSIQDILANENVLENCQKFAKEMQNYNPQSNWLIFLNTLETKRNDANTTRRLATPTKQNRPSAVSLAMQKITEDIKPISKPQNNGYSIFLATKTQDREIIYKMAYQAYREKGYTMTNEKALLITRFDEQKDTAILTVRKDEKIVGTLTLIFDSAIGLPIDSVFHEEINLLRAQGEKIVEVSRLAIDPEYRNSKEVLHLLYNYVFIYSYHVQKYSMLTIEVNPRHKNFYAEALAFEPFSEERPCPHVQNAPAVLMTLPLARYREKLLYYTSEPKTASRKKDRSLYKSFLSPNDEISASIAIAKTHKPLTEQQAEYFGLKEYTNKQ